MAKPAKGVEYLPPASQVDLKNRLEDDFGGNSAVTSPLDSDDDSVNPTEQRDLFAVEGNDTSAYVGVSEEYRTYANDTEKPYAFEGVEGEAVKLQFEGQYAMGKDEKPEAKHTQGGGSSVETVQTHEAGEDFQPDVVDRAAVYAEAEKSEDDKSGDDSSGDNSSDDNPPTVTVPGSNS